MGVYRDAIIHSYKELVARDDTEKINFINKIYADFVSGDYNERFVDIIMQKFSREPIDIYDTYAYFLIWEAMMVGKINFAEIHIGKTPFGDKGVNENNEILSTLRHPFRAEFSPSKGRGYNDDGTFYWDIPIELGIKIPDGTEFQHTVAPWQAPLEVGYTNPETTLMHLKEQGYLARWPYNHDIIYLIRKTDFQLWHMDYAYIFEDLAKKIQ